MRPNFGAAVPLALVLVCAPCAFAETLQVNVDELPTINLPLPNGTTVQAKVYQEHPWRIAEVGILMGENDQDPDVAFEGKFEMIVQPDKLKLVGYEVAPNRDNKKWATIIIDERLRKHASSFKLNDNLWLCGTLRKTGPKYLEFVAVDILKLPPDKQRWERNIERLRKQRDAEGLVELGQRIKREGKRTVNSLDSFDELNKLADRALDEGLTFKEEALKPDDWESMFRAALQWRELRDNTARFRRLVEQILVKNPDHPGASKVAEEEWHWVKFGGKRWCSKEEADAIEARNAKERETERKLEEARRAEEERQRIKDAHDRASKLAASESFLRTADPKAREQALLALGEAAQSCLDTGFGVEAVDILANTPDTAAVRALCTAAKSKEPVVRSQAFEALAWRGGKQDQAALEGFQAALTIEKDRDTAFTAIAAVEVLNAKVAAGVLVRSLDNSNDAVQKLVMDGLRTVTQQQFSQRRDWQEWWSKNKDSFKAP